MSGWREMTEAETKFFEAYNRKERRKEVAAAAVVLTVLTFGIVSALIDLIYFFS